MAKTCYGGHSLTLNGDKFSMDNFAVDNDRLEIAKLVLELALLVLATKEIYSILDNITLSTKVHIRIIESLLGGHNRTASTLNERCHALLKLNLHPFEIL